MGKNTPNDKCSILIMVVFLIFTVAPATAQQGAEARRITGTWNFQAQWRTCDDGTPQLLPVPELRTFDRGKVATVVDSSIWCDFGHCTSLGIWRHVAERRFWSTYKRARLNPDNNQSEGYLIVTSSILYRLDDTLSTTDTLRFYDTTGALEATRCRTAIGTRFTGEN